MFEYNAQEHLRLLQTFEPEHTLKAVLPYNKDRDIDNYGNMMRLTKQGYEAVCFKPFWEM